MAQYDLIVIGGGAAGLSVAAAAGERSVLVIDRMGGGGELMNLGTLVDIEDERTGPDLAGALLEQAITAGAELEVGEVTALLRSPDGWQVTIDGDATHTGRVVVLAVGLGPGTLGVADEAAFEGRGLSHCAACDGPLYAGQPVVVAGSDRWALHEARELAPLAGSVTLLTHGGAVPVDPGVPVLAARITGLAGDDGLESVTIQPDDGGATRTLPARAVFVQTGRRPALDFAPADLARDADGRILVDAALRTNLPGLLAIGDARAGAPRTLAAAIDDARLAATNPLGKSAD